MKRWAFLTMILYAGCVVILTIPLIAWLGDEILSLDKAGLTFILLYTGILMLIQGVLLLVPMDIIQERPVKRRKVVVSAIFGAVPMAVLVFAFCLSVALMIWTEDLPFDFIEGWMLWGFVGLSWLVWAVVFYRSYSPDNPNIYSSRISAWLLRGSILEMLVAIPSHIIARHRDECCSPPVTLLGIAMGLAIALLSFGPGVLFLFSKKIKAKKRG